MTINKYFTTARKLTDSFHTNEEAAPYDGGHGVRQLTLSVFLALLSFFIVLNSLSSVDKNKSDNIKSSVLQEFKEKDIADKIESFTTKKPVRNIEINSIGFPDLINNFMLNYRDKMAYTFYETKSQYVIKIDKLNFYGPNSNRLRANAASFLSSLNDFISTNKKNVNAKAIIILPYLKDNKKSTNDNNYRVKELYSNIPKSGQSYLIYSTVAVATEENDKVEYIYIIFDKNEF